MTLVKNKTIIFSLKLRVHKNVPSREYQCLEFVPYKLFFFFFFKSRVITQLNGLISVS